MSNKPSFPLLSAMISVMEQVVEAERPLRMESFFVPRVASAQIPPDEWTIHNCGTAACVAGYAATDPTVKELVGITSGAVRPLIVWNDLEDEIGDLPAASICATNAKNRKEWAADTSLDLNPDHPHLTSDGTTAADALDYMKHMLKALESRYAN